MVAERFKRFNRSSYARRTNGVCEGAAFSVDVNFKIGGSCADKAWIFDEDAFICEKRDAAKSGCRLVTEIAATNGDYISIDRRCWGWCMPSILLIGKLRSLVTKKTSHPRRWRVL